MRRRETEAWSGRAALSAALLLALANSVQACNPFTLEQKPSGHRLLAAFGMGRRSMQSAPCTCIPSTMNCGCSPYRLAFESATQTTDFFGTTYNKFCWKLTAPGCGLLPAACCAENAALPLNQVLLSISNGCWGTSVFFATVGGQDWFNVDLDGPYRTSSQFIWKGLGLSVNTIPAAGISFCLEVEDRPVCSSLNQLCMTNNGNCTYIFRDRDNATSCPSCGTSGGGPTPSPKPPSPGPPSPKPPSPKPPSPSPPSPKPPSPSPPSPKPPSPSPPSPKPPSKPSPPNPKPPSPSPPSPSPPSPKPPSPSPPSPKPPSSKP
ncbi:hypothetical protein HYH03_018903 [Edaphochlamys debaryana]|uniref:Pherophorin domain-containing protein n=1 Tax=Edaphochlamys debaryana TaxID=47281 RepID=A0A835XF01_9CHLO|nr:hypothetical protein HYH03_018903 [Edaphochlamys debaryana]|eukprot:KAG2482144.1 hypothetical protein HYH03_018903 [Edaphochlamys debaryana]